MKKALLLRNRRNSEPSIKIEKHSVIGASQTYDEHFTRNHSTNKIVLSQTVQIPDFCPD
jgi:hypothetical protein